jgi:hypothetical protein
MIERRLNQLYKVSVIVVLLLTVFVTYQLIQKTTNQPGMKGDIQYSIHRSGSEVIVLVSVRNDDEVGHTYTYEITYFWGNKSRSTSLPVHFGKGEVKTSKISTLLYTQEKVKVNLRILKDGELVEEVTAYPE